MWAMTNEVEFSQDRRYQVLVLLAPFASLRWGEATVLRRCDVDLANGAVRVRAAFAERSTGQLVLGPPKSRAGRRVAQMKGGSAAGRWPGSLCGAGDENRTRTISLGSAAITAA